MQLRGSAHPAGDCVPSLAMTAEEPKEPAETRCYRPLIMGRRRRRRRQPPACDPGRPRRPPRRRQRGRRRRRDLPRARRRRTDDVRPRRRRLLPCPHVPTRRRHEFTRHRPRPAAATPQAFPNGIEIYGPRSISVPGSLAALGAMHREHGSRAWAELVRPAITHASEGFARRTLTATSPPRTTPASLPTRAARQLLDADAPPALGRPDPPTRARRHRSRRIAEEGAERLTAALSPTNSQPASNKPVRPGRRRRPRRLPAASPRPARRPLPRLRGPPNAPELDRLRPAPDARHRRAFRPRRPSARPSASTSSSKPRSAPSSTRERFGADPAPSPPLPLTAYSPPKPPPPTRRPHLARPRRRPPPRDPRAGSRRHHLFLRRRRRGQRRLRHPEHQLRFRVRRVGGRYRRPHEQPHGLLAPRPQPPEPPAAPQARTPHHERAHDLPRPQALGRPRHPRRRQPGAGQPPSPDRDDRPRPGPATAIELPRWTSHVSGQYANYPHTARTSLSSSVAFPNETRRDLPRPSRRYRRRS